VAALSHEAWRARWLPELDPGIAPFVDALHEAGIETFESWKARPDMPSPSPRSDSAAVATRASVPSPWRCPVASQWTRSVATGM